NTFTIFTFGRSKRLIAQDFIAQAGPAREQSEGRAFAKNAKLQSEGCAFAKNAKLESGTGRACALLSNAIAVFYRLHGVFLVVRDEIGVLKKGGGLNAR